MPAGGDNLPERSLKTRATLKLENGVERPYPVERIPVPIGLYALAGPLYERPPAVLEQPASSQSEESVNNNQVEYTDTPIRSTPDSEVGRVTLSSLVVPTPTAVLARHNDAPPITHYVASTSAVV